MCGICFALRQHIRWQESNTSSAACVTRAKASYAVPPGVHEEVTAACDVCRSQQQPLRVELDENEYPSLAAPPPASSGVRHTSLFSSLIHNLRRRGPDHFGTVRRCLPTCHAADYTDGGDVQVSTSFRAEAAVLGLRGAVVVPQPYLLTATTASPSAGAAHDTSFLMWNGEVFGGALCPPPGDSDTVSLARRLHQLETEVSCSSTARRSRADLQANFMSRCEAMLSAEVEGPFGFLYYASQLRCVVFGRDPLGRRSLLVHFFVFDGATSGSVEAELIVSSVGVQHGSPTACGDAAASTDEGRERDKSTPLLPSDISGGKASLKRERGGLAAGEDSDAAEHADCGTPLGGWTELPVTGLFGLDLDAPLLAQPAGDAHGLAALLHVPWGSSLHLVHPLLRTASADLSASASATKADLVPPGELSASDTKLPPLLAEEVARHLGAVLARITAEGGGSPPTAGETCDDARRVVSATVRYLSALGDAVQRRIAAASAGGGGERSAAVHRPVCIAFSGGIDCTMLAALTHFYLPPSTPIELVNVAFGEAAAQAPDRITALRAMHELLCLPQHPSSSNDATGAGGSSFCEREWRLVFVDVPEKQSAQTAHILDLITPRHTVMDLDIGTALWHVAQAKGRMQVLRSSDLPAEPQAASASCGGAEAEQPPCGLAQFSKHFRVPAHHTRPASSTPRSEDNTGATAAPSASSAGQAVRAAAEGDKYDLLRDVLIAEGRHGDGPEAPVLLSTLGKEYGAFLQPHLRQHGYKKLGPFLNDACRAGVISFAEDAPSKAVRLARPADRQRAAASPPQKWFTTRWMAASGSSTPQEGTFAEAYTSESKVLLLGMGADETLGGYTRYRRLYERQGMQGTQQELARDYGRLWQRNLGRDDRVTMDSGREPRFPFLDEQVLHTLEQIVAAQRAVVVSQSETDLASVAGQDELLRRSIEAVLDFRLGPGEGDKRLLRNAAALAGLHTVTRLQKRAIQFGSRIAERKVKGTRQL